MRHRPTAPDAFAHAHALRALVDAVAAAEDEAAALVSGLAEIVAALRADAGVVVRHGAVVASVGWDERPPVLDPRASAPGRAGPAGTRPRPVRGRPRRHRPPPGARRERDAPPALRRGDARRDRAPRRPPRRRARRA